MKYGEHGLDGCAFPALLPEEMGVREGYFDAGMTIHEYAAITLRIPNSGDEQLDAMIRHANRRDAAVAAMQGMRLETGESFTHADWADSHPQRHAERIAKMACIYADALLARLEEEP